MPRPPHPDQEDLIDDLEDLRQRTIDNTFLRQGDTKPLELKVLPSLIERRHTGLWDSDNESAKIEAIKQMLRETISTLPEVVIPATERGSTMTFRRAALIMFDLYEFDDDTKFKIDSYGKHRHDKLTGYIKDEARFYAGQDVFKIKVNKRIRQFIADNLLSPEPRNDMAHPTEHPEEIPRHEAHSEPETETASAARQSGKYNITFEHVNHNHVGDNMKLEYRIYKSESEKE